MHNLVFREMLSQKLQENLINIGLHALGKNPNDYKKWAFSWKLGLDRDPTK